MESKYFDLEINVRNLNTIQLQILMILITRPKHQVVQVAVKKIVHFEFSGLSFSRRGTESWVGDKFYEFFSAKTKLKVNIFKMIA